MKTIKLYTYLIASFTLVLVITFACNSSTKNEDTSVEEYADTSLDNFEISYTLPVDVAANASLEELAAFAWKEFFALNWQSNWNNDSTRTTPDVGWNIGDNDQPDLAVWETYIHRTELINAFTPNQLDLSKGKPHYSFSEYSAPGSFDLNNYWNVLDEDNEIGSSYLFAHDSLYEVMYMAKTNLDEYNYTKDVFSTMESFQGAVTKGSARGLDYYKGLTPAQMCNSGAQNKMDSTVCLPCSDDNQDGTVEIKLAFRQLDPQLGDDLSRYITKEVVVFADDAAKTPEVKTFGLIGMHIIRKTQNHPAFIFASWEQADVKSKNMNTYGIDSPVIDPHQLTPVIPRSIPEPIQKVNAQVKAEIVKANPNSKWQYYQLIGVQGKPVDYTNRATDDSYFMANYVIESDSLLTYFHGTFSDPFNASIQNVAYDQKSFNMGGCMGCHGNAQVDFGTDFSFIVGSKIKDPDPYQRYQDINQ